MALDIFNNVAEQITGQEKAEVVPLILLCLQNATQSKPVSARTISGYLKACNTPKEPPRVRKIISYMVCCHIRRATLASGEEVGIGSKVIVGSGNGYFITDDVRVVSDCEEDLLRRMENIKSRLQSVRVQKQELMYLQKN